MPYVSSFALEQIDDVLFVLLKDLVYEDPVLKIRVTTPAGFVSDGPSVPRVPLLYWLAGGKGKRAGVTHDYLYRNKLLPRNIDDLIFYHALQDHKKLKQYVAYAMYKSVDVCGEKHRKGSRPLCLNTYFECANSQCSTGCMYRDTNAYQNIEFLPGCTLDKSILITPPSV